MKKRSATQDATLPDLSDVDLPEGWTQAKLGDLASAIKGKKPAELLSEKSVGAVPYIDIKAFETGMFREYAVPASSRVAQKGDILIVWDGARSGLVGKMPDQGAVGSTLAVLHPYTGNKDYLYLFLQANYDEINTNVRGTGIPHVDPEILWKLEVPLPPLAEQKRIVAKVGEMLTRVDAARDHLAKVPAILKRFRQSVLAAACSGRLTENWRAATDATDWEEKTLGEIVSVVTSGSRGWAKRYAASGPIFIRAQNLSSDCLDLSDVAHVQLPAKDEGTRTLVSVNDILVTITGANVTKTAIVSENIGEAYVNQHVALVRLQDSEKAPYVWLWLISPEHGRSQLLDAAYGAGKPGLNLKQVREVRVDIPSLPEQHEIVRRVDQLFSLAASIEKQVAAGTAMVEKLTQAILAKAFRGEIVPAEADLARNEGRDYEDGAALLNRVCAQAKAQLPAGGWFPKSKGSTPK